MKSRKQQEETRRSFIQPATAVKTTDVPRRPADYKIGQVIAASAVGTMIEWYDFYIFGRGLRRRSFSW